MAGQACARTGQVIERVPAPAGSSDTRDACPVHPPAMRGDPAGEQALLPLQAASSKESMQQLAHGWGRRWWRHIVGQCLRQPGPLPACLGSGYHPIGMTRCYAIRSGPYEGHAGKGRLQPLVACEWWPHGAPAAQEDSPSRHLSG